MAKRAAADGRWARLGLVLLLLCFVALVCMGLDQLSWSDDEGVFVYTAKAVLQGHSLYSTVWFNYLPGFVRWLQAVFALTGVSLEVGRLSVLFLVVSTLGALWWLAQDRLEPWGATAMMAMLVSTPHLVSLSGAVMADVPSAALAACAVVAAMRSLKGEHDLGWLAVAGLGLAISLWLKPTTAASVLPLVLAALWAPEGRQRWRRLLALGGALGGGLLLMLLFEDVAGLGTQFLQSWRASQGAFSLDLGDNLHDIWRYFSADKYDLWHYGFLGLALLGLWSLWRDRRPQAAVATVWLLAALVSLAFHAPLYRHHLLQLLFPCAYLGGVGFTTAIDWLRSRDGRPAWGRQGLAAILLVALLAEMALGLYCSATRLEAIEAEHVVASEAAMAFLGDHTSPGDTVITDGHILALRAGLDIPPETTNTSRMRIRTGQLDDATMIALAARDRPQAIVFWEKKLDSLDEFAAWVQAHYDLGVTYSERFRIYVLPG